MFRLLFFLLFPVLLRAVVVIEGPQVVREGDAIFIHWKTDGPAGGKVRYGLSEDKMESVEDGVAAEHKLRLPALKPGSYAYTVGTARKPLAKGTFTIEERKGPVAKMGEAIRDILPGGDKPKPPAPSPAAAPPARDTWSAIRTLQDHFDRHGADFSAKSPEDYAGQAWRFRERAVAERLPMKHDGDTVRAYDPKTGSFGAFTRDGKTRTYFKPGSRDYWQRQPGRAITSPPWISK
jgi:hypothetical protein